MDTLLIEKSNLNKVITPCYLIQCYENNDELLTLTQLGVWPIDTSTICQI